MNEIKMIPKYNWEKRYNLLIKQFSKGYTIHVGGIHVEYIGDKFEVYKMLIEDFPEIEWLLELPFELPEQEQDEQFWENWRETVLPRYNWEDECYNITIKKVLNGYVINYNGIEKMYWGQLSSEMYDMMVEDFPILKNLLEHPELPS